MRPLPYFVPENDWHLNVATLIIILQTLGASERGKLLLNNERLRIILYLVKNPLVMNKVLWRLGAPPAHLEEQDCYSVASLSINLDPLFDTTHLKDLLKHIASLELINVGYRVSDGFLYQLTSQGKALAEQLSGDYLDKVRKHLKSLTAINSTSTSALNSVIESILNGELYVN